MRKQDAFVDEQSVTRAGVNQYSESKRLSVRLSLRSPSLPVLFPTL